MFAVLCSLNNRLIFKTPDVQTVFTKVEGEAFS